MAIAALAWRTVSGAATRARVMMAMPPARSRGTQPNGDSSVGGPAAAQGWRRNQGNVAHEKVGAVLYSPVAAHS